MNDSNLIQSTPTQAQLLHFIINSGLDDNVKKTTGYVAILNTKHIQSF